MPPMTTRFLQKASQATEQLTHRTKPPGDLGVINIVFIVFCMFVFCVYLIRVIGVT
jgi:hypothetical protein